MIEKNDFRLTSFVLGELNDAESAEIQTAIDSSPELQAVVNEIRQTVDLLGAAYQAEEPLSLLAEQKAALAMTGADPSVAGSRSSSGRPWLPIALAASLLGLLVGGAIYMQGLPVTHDVAAKVKQLEEMNNEQLKFAADSIKADSMEVNGIEAGMVTGSDAGIEAADQAKSAIVAGKASIEGLKDEEENVSEEFFATKKSAEVVRGGAMAARASRGGKRVRPDSQQLPAGDEKGKESGFWSTLVERDEAAAAMPLADMPQAIASANGRFDAQLSRDKFSPPSQEALASDEFEKEGRFRFGAGGGGFGGGDGRNGDISGDGKWEDFSTRELAGEDAETWRFELGRSGEDGRGSSTRGERFSYGTASGDVDGEAVLDPTQGISGRRDQSISPAVLLPKQGVAQNEDSLLGDDDDGRQAGGTPLLGAASSTHDRRTEDFGATGKSQSQPKLAAISSEAQALGLEVDASKELSKGIRGVPVERMRTENRTRSVENASGDMVDEVYEVQVPYTENRPDDAPDDAIGRGSEMTPRVYFDIKPEESQRLVDQLTKRFDPNLRREFGLRELFAESVKELQGRDNFPAGGRLKADQLGKSQAGEAENGKVENGKVETASRGPRELLLAEKLYAQLTNDAKKKLPGDATPALRKIELALKNRNAEVRRNRTWKRVKAIPNTTRLMVGDKDELDMTGMQVNVQVDGFRARVLIDCFYYNDRGQQLEGNFKLRLPDDASLYYFAFGESAYEMEVKGQLAKEEFLEDEETQFVSLTAPEIRKARKDAWENVKESRMVPREQAAHAYRETVRRKVDPALVEWSGAGVFNARVFPLAPHKLHRIVIGYDVNLTQVDGDWVYELDLPEQTGQCRVDLNVQPIDVVEYKIEPESDPFQKVAAGKSLRRYRFHGPQKNGIRLVASQVAATMLHSSDETEGEFWGVQVKPDLPVEEVAGNSKAIFLLDTSLSSNPDKFNVWLKLLESTLENNRDSLKQFNVLFFNVDAKFWQDEYVDNTKENVERLNAKCQTLALEGATDLYGAVEKITQSKWVYGSDADGGHGGPDLFLLSDGAANWGETNLRLLDRQISDNGLGSVFAYQTGLTGTAISGLRFLAGQSGGAVFSVATEDEIKTASTAHRKRPWKLNTISAKGASDVMIAGRVHWVYPGQSITVVGRGTVDGELGLEFEQSGQTELISFSPTRMESELASRLYGQVAVGQLESLGAKVFDVAASYARHFRVTGETCSLLMLDSEEDYKRFDIKPQEDLFVIKTKNAKSLVFEMLEKSANELADPKAQLLSWIERLETMPGMSFKMPTALGLAMEEIQVNAISQPLDCSLINRDSLSKEYLAAIDADRLDYDLIAAEAKRRGVTSVDDAIKVFSSLVERNPGDLVVARDVAYTALEMGRPAQAYHLLRNVAIARPFEGSVYPALGQCLSQLGESDMAIVYYEIALGSEFNRMGNDFKKIVSAEYMHLLRRIVSGDLESSVNDFAAARLATLSKTLSFESADLLITMMWNTDQTDVDLHIVEPSGEECSYENKTTRSGGQITSDVTTGFGPEMYFLSDAPAGKYDVKVKYFANRQNRTELRNKVHLTIYRGFGTSAERVTRKTIQLKTVGEKESVATVGVDE